MLYRTILTMVLILLLLLASSACDPTATPTPSPTIAIPVATPSLTNTPVPTAIPTPTPTLIPTSTQTPRVAMPTVSAEVEAEEYAVYSALISNWDTRETVKLIVILDQTDVEMLDMDYYIVQNRQALPPEVVADFAAKNRRSSPLGEHFDLGVEYVLISQDELPQILWDDFYEKYPDAPGFMWLSRVGFNPSQDMALVYVGNPRAFLAGMGALVLLSKTDGIWHRTRSIMVWIS
ncbi:MAG: hypothetical protein KKA73_28500 [Chloroflexi bacterium]|nr:hypothetical protein [Chloroflexota bacterium]MBU1751635.1 hypothetical protein [Chloroflexota bacterium]